MKLKHNREKTDRSVSVTQFFADVKREDKIQAF